MTATALAWISELVERTAPASALLISEDPESLAPAFDAVAVCETCTPANPPPRGQRYALACLVGVLGVMPKPAASALIATWRDLGSEHLLLVEDLTLSDWSEGDLLGLGLKRASGYRPNPGEPSIYEFTLATYKATPRWLNRKNWANPEMWDKFRW